MSNRARFALDLAALLAMLAANNPSATGISIHEWVSVALAFALFVHVVVNWEWCASTARTLFARMRAARRADFVVDATLLVAFVTVTVSGLLMSKAVMPLFGLHLTATPIARVAHSLSADATIALLAVHFGLHWGWFARTAKCLVARPERREACLAPEPAMQEGGTR